MIYRAVFQTQFAKLLTRRIQNSRPIASISTTIVHVVHHAASRIPVYVDTWEHRKSFFAIINEDNKIITLYVPVTLHCCFSDVGVNHVYYFCRTLL
ncbi:MAG: hypothetical protein ACI8RD_006819 [Bacillariaceae sp.]|jgi:hypothetical protein